MNETMKKPRIANAMRGFFCGVQSSSLKLPLWWRTGAAGSPVRA